MKINKAFKVCKVSAERDGFRAEYKTRFNSGAGTFATPEIAYAWLIARGAVTAQIEFLA